MSDLISRQAAIDVLSLGKEILSRVLDDMDVVGTDREKYSWGLGLIDRQAAIDALMKRDKELRNINWYDKPYAEGECRGIDEALAIVSNLPSAQPERKKGAWTDDNACPFCGFQPWYERDIHTLSYCPNCGADMRKDGD